VRTAIRLLLEDPGLALLDDLPDGWQGLELPGIDLLRNLFDTAADQPGISGAALVERHHQSSAWEPLKRLFATPIETPEGGMVTEFTGALSQLVHRANELELDRLMKKAKRPSDLSSEEIQRLMKLQGSQHH